jgi:hypothetical protein
MHEKTHGGALIINVGTYEKPRVLVRDGYKYALVYRYHSHAMRFDLRSKR